MGANPSGIGRCRPRPSSLEARAFAKGRGPAKFFIYKGDLAAFGPKALLLVPTQDLEEMRRILHEYRPLIQEFAQATNLNSLFRLVNKQFRTAAGAETAATESLVQHIPSLQRLLEQARQSLLGPGIPPSPGVETLFAGGEQAEQSTYLAFDRGRVYLLTVQPKSEALTPEAIEELRRLISTTQFEVPGVNVGLTGEPVLEYDEMRPNVNGSVNEIDSAEEPLWSKSDSEKDHLRCIPRQFKSRTDEASA